MPNTMPGVRVRQTPTATAATSNAPDMRPVLVGVCRQIVELRDSDGLPNGDALCARAYDQASQALAQSAFPDPRNNIGEVNVEEDRVSAALLYGGRFTELQRGSHGRKGSSFLKADRDSRRAGIRSSLAEPYVFDGTVGNVLTFCVDVVNPTSTRDDVTVTLVGTLSAESVAEAINTAAGAEIASAVLYESDYYVQIASNTRGATSSVTLRQGTSALPILFGSGVDASVAYRVDGAGYAAQDDSDGDLTSPWIEWRRGTYYVADVATDFPAPALEDTVWPVLIDKDDTAYTSRTAAKTFLGSGASVPILAATSTRPGDVFLADGVSPVASGEITRVEAARFRLGTLNTTQTTFDGTEPVARVYDTREVNTLYNGAPMAPADVCFIAQGLVFGEVSPAGVAASRSGETAGLPARAAVVMSSSAITFPVSLASLSLDYRVTREGVDGDDASFVFTGGPYANIGALTDAMSSDMAAAGITVSNSGNRLLLSTTERSAGAGISVLASGSANTALRFSTSNATSDTGKDVELAEQASVTGLPLTLPLVGTYVLALVVEDAKGTHTLSRTVVLDGLETATELRAAIASAFGGAGDDPVIYAGAGGDGTGGIRVATVEVLDREEGTVEVVITTIEGGTAVELTVTADDVESGGRLLGFYDTGMGVPATVVAEDAVTDFAALRGGVNTGTYKEIRITTTGLANDLADTTLTVGGSGASTLPEVAAVLQTALRAAIVAAGNAAIEATVVWDRVDDRIVITIPGATQIEVETGSSNDLTAVLFGTFTGVQAGDTWTSGGPDVDYAIVSLSFDEGSGSLSVSTSVGLSEVQTSTTALDIVRVLNADDDANGNNVASHTAIHWYVDANGKICARTIAGGASVSLGANGATDGIVALGFADDVTDDGSAGDNASDVGADILKSTTLRVYFDNNPHAYRASFSSNSLAEAADEMNAVVGGSSDVASVASDDTFVLTSLLSGAASAVEVTVDGGDTAGQVLGLVGRSTGSGRPNPDFYLDDTGEAHIGPSILRDMVTGVPYDMVGAGAPVYIGYRAVRQDVTARASQRGILALGSVEEAEAAIGPFTTENPLGLAVLLALGAAPDTTVYALGVDEADDAAPYGTYDAWVRALEALEAYEVYSIAALTDDMVCNTAIAAHVNAMSAENGRMERIAFVWTPVPERAVPTTLVSGSAGASNGADNSFSLDVNPGSALLAAGVNASGTIPASSGVYLEMRTTDAGATTLRRLNVSRVTGTTLTLRTSFGASDNSDGFYDTATLDGTLGLSGQDWSLKKRGALLRIPGTTLPDKEAIVEAGAAEAEVFASRRVYHTYCSAVEVSIDGLAVRVPGFYASAAIVGMVAVIPIFASLTGMSITGLGRCYGTEDGTLTPSQISVLKDGGRMVLGLRAGTTTCMQSVSTKTGLPKDAELAITKCLDRVSKRLRAALHTMTGGENVINPNWEAGVSMTLQSVLQTEQDERTILAFGRPTLATDPADPRGAVVAVDVTVGYPANTLRIELSY